MRGERSHYLIQRKCLVWIRCVNLPRHRFSCKPRVFDNCMHCRTFFASAARHKCGYLYFVLIIWLKRSSRRRMSFSSSYSYCISILSSTVCVLSDSKGAVFIVQHTKQSAFYFWYTLLKICVWMVQKAVDLEHLIYRFSLRSSWVDSQIFIKSAYLGLGVIV